jgi:hypothetical protein
MKKFRSSTGCRYAAPPKAVFTPPPNQRQKPRMGYRQVLDVARPYLGERVGVYGDWSPLDGRRQLCAEVLDTDDPLAVQEYPRLIGSAPPAVRFAQGNSFGMKSRRAAGIEVCSARFGDACAALWCDSRQRGRDGY